MTEPHATARILTQQREMGRLMPRRFSRPAWHRFNRDRRRRYLADLSCPPNNEQAARIEALVRLEWFSLKAEAEGTLQGDRESREHRRLFDRILGDWKRALEAPAKATKPPMDAVEYGRLLDARRAAETSPKRRTAPVAG